MSKNVGHFTDEEEDEYKEPSRLEMTVLFVLFVLPWLFGWGAIIGLLFFNGSF